MCCPVLPVVKWMRYHRATKLTLISSGTFLFAPAYKLFQEGSIMKPLHLILTSSGNSFFGILLNQCSADFFNLCPFSAPEMFPLFKENIHELMTIHCWMKSLHILHASDEKSFLSKFSYDNSYFDKDK